ncbi:MAG: MFS transporter [archaeon]
MNFKEEFHTAGFFYIISLVYWISIGIMGAYWTLYLIKQGIPFTSVALILIMTQIASFLFEIPTGAIADIYGRKVSVFISYFLSALCYFGILLSKSNISLLLGLYFILGIAYTFETGALDSWFVDTVKHKKQSKHLHKFFGRWGSTSSIGFVIGPLIGGFLVLSGVDKALWATAFVMLLLSGIVLFFGKEEYFQRKKVDLRKSFNETYITSRKGIKHTWNNKSIFILALVMFILTFAITLAYNSYQPYVVSIGLNASYLGFALSIAGFISIFSLNYSHKITKFLGGNKRSLILFTLLLGLAIMSLGLMKYLPLLFFSLIFYTCLYEFAGPSSPAYRELFHKNTPSKIRATVSSVSSLWNTVGSILALISFGLISTYISLQTGLIVAGVTIIITAFIYIKLRKK